MIKVLSVVGATASGKTKLAIQLAQQLNGEIVSCDSVQIYKYFNIASAKPSPEELQAAPHHLIDLLEPSSICNAGLWKEYSIKCVEDINSRGKLPIIVGGTGLYLKSLYLGMFEQNSRDENYRQQLQNQVKTDGLGHLYQQLQQIDSAYAQKISSNDELRIIRALEATKVTGIKFSELHQHNVKPSWEWTFTKPSLDRESIYQNIETRIHQMLSNGLIEEVESLLDKFGGSVPPMSSIGYRHVCEYLSNKKTKQEMLQTLILDTRHFAKRQETLFRSLVPNLSDSEILLQKGV